jgi:hypothetical protein
MPKTIREAAEKVLGAYFNMHHGYQVPYEDMEALRTACAEAEAAMPETVEELVVIIQDIVPMYTASATLLAQRLAERGVGQVETGAKLEGILQALTTLFEESCSVVGLQLVEDLRKELAAQRPTDDEQEQTNDDPS